MSTETIIEFLRVHTEDGSKPIIEFTKSVERLNGYAKAGMRAHLIGHLSTRDEKVAFRVSYHGFENFNRGLEDANGVCPYNIRETFYVMPTDDPKKYFSTVEPECGSTEERRGANGEQVYVSLPEDHGLVLTKAMQLPKPIRRIRF